jgi:MtN3 and saliva related transmembrane protein
MTQAIGWLSSAILVVTISTQLRKQWRSRSSQGVSKWLYIGQIAASTGFIFYSAQSRDWVFVATNTVLGLEAMFGLGLVLAQRRAASHTRAGRMAAGATSRTPA